MRRAFVIVLDACGVGALPDAAEYGDAGTNTLAHVAAAHGGLELPVLESLGLGSILALDGVAPAPAPVVHGRLHALGHGKDSSAGHRELMGLVAASAPPTYPGGFPPDVIATVSAAAGGRGVICNRTDNGIEAIDQFGAAHVRDGELIVYTSQDSVLQIAAHVDVVAPERLYEICQAVRTTLPDRHAVGRVIARPFAGAPGAFARTDGRRDYALEPPGPSYLDALRDHGVAVHSVGKVASLFAGRGIDATHPGATNAAALDSTEALLDELDAGLVFCNLIETDQVYGHRHDVAGFAGALEAIDARLGTWLGRLGVDDLLVVCADHGCDPDSPRTDHTREHAPLLARFADSAGAPVSRRHDGPFADVGASVLRWPAGPSARGPGLPGSAFV